MKKNDTGTNLEVANCDFKTEVSFDSNIKGMIYLIRNTQVMLDGDLATLYGVEVKRLNEQVRRNIERFPEDFRFQLTKEECSRSQIATLFDSANLLPSGLIPAGAEFDAMRYVTRLIANAKNEIVLIDPYSDAVTLDVLAKKQPGVKVRLFCKDRGQPTATEIAKFNKQYKDLTVSYSDDFHDRFLIIDNTDLHALGSSINSLGRRVTTYTTRDPKEISKLMKMLPA